MSTKKGEPSPIKSWADFPELRFDINNCRTLCRFCHYQVTFGKPMQDRNNNWGRYQRPEGMA